MIGNQLRKERERLQLSQHAFGRIGGVGQNAQGHYENGCRAPKADYLAAVAAAGVDILFVLTGRATPASIYNLSLAEEIVLLNLRSLPREDRDAIWQLTTSLAESQSSYIKLDKSADD
mgnify:FL=1